MRHKDAGFTLLEVIVALAIATASVASLYQIYTLGWRGVRLAAIDSAALEVAKNQLASAGLESPMVEGITSGLSPEGVSWTSEIRAYEPPGGGGFEATGPLAYWVNVKVVWREGPARPQRSIELQTIKLKSGP